MAALRNRQCDVCGDVKYTRSRASTCLKCQKIKTREETVSRQILDITNAGYEILEGPFKDSDGHNCFTLKTPCEHVWTSKHVNFNTLYKQAIKNNTPMPCGTCGPKHRMNTALKGYLEKYARDYNLADYQDYSSVVRGLSDKMYKMFKKEINPDNHRRGAKLYHLDHIIPIIECFKRGWPIEQAAHPDNLQMLFWYDNLLKSSKII